MPVLTQVVATGSLLYYTMLHLYDNCALPNQVVCVCAQCCHLALYDVIEVKSRQYLHGSDVKTVFPSKYSN